MKYIFLNVLIFSITSLLAQERKTVAQVGNTSTIIGGFMTKPSILTNGNQIEGNRFLLENWKNKGELYSQGKVLRLDNINYDIYSNQFSQSKQGDSLFIFDNKLIDSAKINGRSMKPDDNQKFNEVLVEGKEVNLYKTFRAEIIEGMFNPTDGTTQPSRFKIVDDYLITYHGKTEPFKFNKKQVLEVISEHKSETEKYIKANNLSLKKEEDVIKIFKYYNTL